MIELSGSTARRGAMAGESQETASPIDRFMPRPDVRKRHQTLVQAPAPVVLEVARDFDLNSIALVRWIFWLRSRLMRARTPSREFPGAGLVAATLGMGWGVLDEVPERVFIAGAACQPWKADVVFTPVPPERFASFAEPDQVVIAWTLEAEPLGPARTRFASETRVRATDDEARVKFRRYWRVFGIGTVVIRLLMLPAVRREAERRWRASGSAGG